MYIGVDLGSTNIHGFVLLWEKRLSRWESLFDIDYITSSISIISQKSAIAAV